MADPLQSDKVRDPSTWPIEMRQQWGDDEGASYDIKHRQELVANFRWIRAEIDRFSPDLVLILGDDQYENFRKDGVPAFQVGAYERFDVQPWQSDGHHFKGGANNPWGEPESQRFSYLGHKTAGKHVAAGLLETGFDVSYAYESRRMPMAHAFLNTTLFLDWDRTGFPYPILPFAVNCYGRTLVPLRGLGVNTLDQIPAPDELDPPAPQPWRCYDLGVALGGILAASPWRVAIIASGSWSHAWTSPSTNYFHPNVDADRRFLTAFENGNFDFWRQASADELEANGQHELICWNILFGAMTATGRKSSEIRFMPSWITNADKVFAVI